MFLTNIPLLLWFTLYLINVFYLGSLFFSHLISLRFGSTIEKLAYQFAVGNVILSLIFIYLGMFHLLYANLLAVVYFLPVIFSAVSFFKTRTRSLKSLKRSLGSIARWAHKNPLYLTVILLIVFPLIPYLFLYPGSWDALAYHLVLPKLYLKEHFFPMRIWFAESANPIGLESIFAMGEVFHDPRLANLINFSFIIVTVAYITHGLRYIFAKNVLLFAGLLFLVRPIFYTEFAFNPNVDYPLAFYGIILTMSMAKFIGATSFKLLSLIIALAFFCFMIKYTGLILVFTVLVTLALYFWIQYLRRRQRVKVDFKLSWQRLIVIMVMLSTIIPSVFWLTRNFIYTGNPVYPYFRGFFPDYEKKLGIKEVTQVIHNENLYWIDSYHNLIIHNDNSQDYLMLFERYSVFLLLGVLIVGIVQNTNPTVRYLSISSLIFFLGIKFTVGPLFRYYFPVYPAMCLIYAYLFFYFLKKKWYLGIVPVAILLGSFFVQIDVTFYRRFVTFITTPKLDWIYSFNDSFAKKQIVRQDNWDAVSYVNKNLSSKDVALVMFDNRLYYYDIPVIYANTLIYFSVKNPMNLEQTLNFLKDQKIDYIVESDNWGVPTYINKKLYDQFIKTYGQKVFQGTTTVVYKII